MTRTGARINLSIETARQHKSSQQILREFYEDGHKYVGVLSEDDGRYPYYVLYQGPEGSTSLPLENSTWGSEFDEEDNSVVFEEKLDENNAMHVATRKGKEVVIVGSTVEEPSRVIVFNEPDAKMLRHLRPLYIKAHIKNVSMSRVLVDNGVAVNVMPTRMLRKLGKSENELIPTEVFVTSFNSGSTTTRGYHQ
ncbi:unnamed protein product [Linum trigynum]|uniref:Uncharacterized protein n=1 Tax=Linum trigynum TaxID=586398 RepID=A0AAV2FYF3_9ROSI